MMKTLAITTMYFGLLGMLGCGAGQAHASSTPGNVTLAPQGAPCPEIQKASAPMTDPTPDTCGSGSDGEKDEVPEQVFDLRAGASQSREALTFTVCVETLFVGPFSAQVCGSGRGLFLDKRDPVPELTHYRARLRLARASLGRLWLVPIVQAGMSELRAGTLGAEYLPGRGSSRQLALGPAAGGALQLLWPLGNGLELVGDIHLEAAWIPRADELVLRQDELQPALGATVGLGF